MSLPKILLHLEGLTVFAAAIAIYAERGYSALAFILLILLPDLSMVGYLVNQKMGSYVYNAAHFYAAPLVLIALGWWGDWSLGIQLGLIWVAHIGMDRLAGYGLKYPDAFKSTHLNRV